MKTGANWSLEERAKAISDGIPVLIRAKLAYKQSQELEHWRLGNPYESSVPNSRTRFYFEGVCYNPQTDFSREKIRDAINDSI